LVRSSGILLPVASLPNGRIDREADLGVIKPPVDRTGRLA